MKRIILLSIIVILFSLLKLIPISANHEPIEWTEAELTFMKNHPVIELGVDPQFVPFEFIDEHGEHKGIAPDFLSLISEKTGLQFVVRDNLSWPEAYNLALNRELDMLPAIGKTTEREEHFLFSAPYYYFKRVIATNEKQTQIASIDDLSGQTVAVQQNSSHHSYLLDYENINLSLYDSVEAALVAVMTGEESAFIGNLATTNYLIHTNGLTNLRLISFEAEKQQALHFAVRPDWPELVSILDKTVQVITEQERNEINKQWIDLDTKLDYGPIIRIITIIGIIIAIIFTVSSFWIIRLRKEIAERKRIEQDLITANIATDEANKDLRKANEELEKISMVDGLTGIFNRRYFDTFLEQLWEINMREKFPIALIMTDIDRFKNYNDTYGHLAGDQCLKNVATIINETVSRKGDFVARYGGEEFAILLSNTSETDAIKLAEKIRRKIENEVIDNGLAKTSITISLGVASMVSRKLITADDLIEIADQALYQAKKNGRNCVVAASSLRIVNIESRQS